MWLHAGGGCPASLWGSPHGVLEFPGVAVRWSCLLSASPCPREGDSEPGSLHSAAIDPPSLLPANRLSFSLPTIHPCPSPPPLCIHPCTPSARCPLAPTCPLLTPPSLCPSGAARGRARGCCTRGPPGGWRRGRVCEGLHGWARGLSPASVSVRGRIVRTLRKSLNSNGYCLYLIVVTRSS